jgi:GTP cyclohydrolase IA
VDPQPAGKNVVDLHPGDRFASPRRLSAAEWERFEGYVGEIFTAFGMDLHTPGTRDTPRRFLRALHDSTAGYDGDEKLLTAFPSEAPSGPESASAQIVEGPIAFASLCEHHALPFHGVAHIGYIAGDEIIGISKLTRLVRLFARRFTVQERLGEQIADALVELIEPRGVAVHLAASHLCTQMRGVEEHSRTVTTFWRGAFEDPALRSEFLLEVHARA